MEPGKLANKMIYLREELYILANWWYVQHSNASTLFYAFERKHGFFIEELDKIAGSLKLDTIHHHHKLIKEQSHRRRQSRKLNTTKLNIIRTRMLFLSDYTVATGEQLQGRRMARIRNNYCKRMRFFARSCEQAAASILSKKQ
jgi:hypothetical protein